MAPPNQLAERDALVRRAIGDREAFGQLFDDYYPRILRYLFARLHNQVAAEDAASITFLQVARGLPAFPGRTDLDFRRWVFRIATNAANDLLRRQKIRREFAGPPPDIATAATAHHQEDWATVATAIAQLPEPKQTLITLRFLEQLAVDDIATIVGMKPGTVRTALSRALAQLRKQLAPSSEPPIGISPHRAAEFPQ